KKSISARTRAGWVARSSRAMTSRAYSVNPNRRLLHDVLGVRRRTRLFERAAIGKSRVHILSAARAILQRMHLHRDLIAGLHRVRLPPLLRDLADPAHFERPFDGLARLL